MSIKIIYAFIIKFDSHLLTDDEASKLINSVFDTLAQHEQYKNITTINTNLLFRASQNVLSLLLHLYQCVFVDYF